jgi:hypothetical protein
MQDKEQIKKISSLRHHKQQKQTEKEKKEQNVSALE